MPLTRVFSVCVQPERSGCEREWDGAGSGTVPETREDLAASSEAAENRWRALGGFERSCDRTSGANDPCCVEWTRAGLGQKQGHQGRVSWCPL